MYVTLLGIGINPDRQTNHPVYTVIQAILSALRENQCDVYQQFQSFQSSFFR
jgi:hypothetical protein